MIIPLKPERKDIYKAYIMCLNPVLKLKKREVEVLDIVAKTYFHLNKAAQKGEVPKKEIYSRMYGGAGRKIMRDAIGMSSSSFNNHLLQLRKKNVINDLGELPDFLTNLKKDHNNIRIQYIISFDEKN
jgi:hypothetical protein